MNDKINTENLSDAVIDDEVLIDARKASLCENIDDEIGSPETTREMLSTQFNFKDYIQFGTPPHKPKPDQAFLEWFIGFFEAEGAFLKWPNTNKNDNRDRFGVETTQKDVKLINKIRTRLGFGRVTTFEKQQESYSRYYVNNLENLKRVIYLLNGNLVTVKRQSQFKNWLNAFNARHGTNILFLETKPKISLNNGWLSGFFEGDGGFFSSVSVSVNKKGVQRFRVKTRFYVTQKGEEQLFAELKNLFKNINALYQITNGRTPEKYNRYELNTVSSQKIIVEYLKRYPFRGKRQITFLRWARTLNYRLEKYPVTPRSIKKVEQLVFSIRKNKID